MQLAQRAFVPICSYSRRLHARVSATHALALVTNQFSESLILIADSLQEINLMRKGLSPSVAARNANIDASNLTSMCNTIVRSNGWKNLAIVRMSEVLASEDLQRIRDALLWALQREPAFTREAQRFTSWAARKFSWEPVAHAGALEMEYLRSEALVSLYVTEVLGYTCEIWEKLPGPAVPDPLAVAYEAASKSLCIVLQKNTLQRTVISLDSLEATSYGALGNAGSMRALQAPMLGDESSQARDSQRRSKPAAR
jgi:hypothetical protein